jgi:putative phosphoribosyl transferase
MDRKTWERPNDHEGMFRDRREAGERLAGALAAYRGPDTLVLGIPRGGVPVAAAVARRLDADLDIVVARKIGAPGQAELAIGAVTADGERWLNTALIAALAVPEDYLAAQLAAQLAEARRREGFLRGGLPARSAAGRCAVVVDDGLATGATMRAAVAAVRRQGPARLVAAVPVGARESCAALRPEVDELVCLCEPEPFWAVGLYYREFAPTEDAEVQALLRACAAERPAVPTSTA